MSDLLCVGVLRVSTSKQRDSGLSLIAQKAEILASVAAVGGKVIAWFEDIEDGALMDRPGLQAALARCALTGASIVFQTLDRAARSVPVWEYIKAKAALGGFRARMADMWDADELTLGFLVLMAAKEKEKISTRTKAALKVKAAELALIGKRLGSPQGSASFKGRQAVGTARSSEVQGAKADAKAEELRSDVESLVADGMNNRQIAEALTARHIQTARKGIWTSSGVRAVLVRLARIDQVERMTAAA